jgi:type I restriction enzyme S subunit
VGKWEVLDFEEVILDDTKNATKIKKEDYLEQGLYPIIDQGQNLIAGYRNNHDGLYSNVPVIVFGDHTRIIKYIDTPFFLGADGVKLLKSKRENLDYKYLYYYFINKQIPNTGYNRHFKWLKKLVIPIPPLETQKEIAKTLDTAAELLALRKQQLAELDNLIKSIFCDMFGDPITNEKGWEVDIVDNVCARIIGGGTPAKSRSEYYIGNIPWVTPKDMKTIWINDSIDHINEYAIENSSTKLIPSYSVLMVIRSGILKKMLPVAINTVDIAINQDMKAFVTNENVLPEYLLYFFILMQGSIIKNVRAVTADNIEFSLIKNLRIPIAPLALQNQFATIVTKIEEQKALVKKAIDETQYLFDSLMSEYFD